MNAPQSHRRRWSRPLAIVAASALGLTIAAPAAQAASDDLSRASSGNRIVLPFRDDPYEIFGDDPYEIFGDDPYEIFGDDPYEIFGDDPYEIFTAPGTGSLR